MGFSKICFPKSVVLHDVASASRCRVRIASNCTMWPLPLDAERILLYENSANQKCFFPKWAFQKFVFQNMFFPEFIFPTSVCSTSFFYKIGFSQIGFCETGFSKLGLSKIGFSRINSSQFGFGRINTCLKQLDRDRANNITTVGCLTCGYITTLTWLYNHITVVI